MENEEFSCFRMSNGRYIMDVAQSEKMTYISSVHPELRHFTNGTAYEWNETGMSELFSECYKNDTRYCPEAKSWYTYSDGAWRKDVGNILVAEKIKEFYRLMSIYCGEIQDDELRKQYTGFVCKMGDRRFRDRLMKDATGVMSISAEEFDKNPYLINCLNGTYDLEKMEFREHDWRDFLTMQTRFEYTMQDVRCERWEKFIDEVTCNDKDKSEYLQKALGYSMLGKANEECMFILHGKTTRNGKSTMLSAIDYMLGSYSSVSPVAIICKSSQNKNAEAANPMLASLKGKRFVTMAESNQYGRLDEEMIKQLTGGEEIKARNLYECATTFLPQFTLWLSCNDLPAVSDKSLFASDRVRVIEFNRHFTEEEQDKNLKSEFQTQAAMQGIFTWLITGYFKYKRFGLKMSPAMREVVKRYEYDNDIVLQFLMDTCEHAEGYQIRTKLLYDTYKIWCNSNGYKHYQSKRFYADVDTHPEWHDGQIVCDGYTAYKNLKLKGT